MGSSPFPKMHLLALSLCLYLLFIFPISFPFFRPVILIPPFLLNPKDRLKEKNRGNKMGVKEWGKWLKRSCIALSFTARPIFYFSDFCPRKIGLK